MNGIQSQFIANLTHDPELRFTPAGNKVVNLRFAVTDRYFDRQSNAWKDGETTFLTGELWHDAAENATESLQRGDRVLVFTSGTKIEEYDARDGSGKRQRVVIRVDEIGPSLRFATAKVVKTDRIRGGLPSATPATTEDPWATGPRAGSGDAPF